LRRSLNLHLSGVGLTFCAVREIHIHAPGEVV
jgi:hypothetical protein